MSSDSAQASTEAEEIVSLLPSGAPAWTWHDLGICKAERVMDALMWLAFAGKLVHKPAGQVQED